MSVIGDTCIFGVLEPSVVYRLSTGDFILPVNLSLADVAVNPTGLIVDVAYTSIDVNPASGDWVAGTWESVTEYGTTIYFAKFAYSSLAAGEIDVWARVLDGTNTYVQLIARVEIR